MERIGRQLGGVPLGGLQAAEEVFGVVDREARGLEDGGALDGFGEGSGGGAGGAAALGVEGDRGDTAAGDGQERRERSPQAAPPAAPVKASSGAGPRRVSSREEVVEELPIHWIKGTE